MGVGRRADGGAGARLGQPRRAVQRDGGRRSADGGLPRGGVRRPAHGRSTGRLASLPEFARALRAVARGGGTGSRARRPLARRRRGDPRAPRRARGRARRAARGAGRRGPLLDGVRRPPAAAARHPSRHAPEPRDPAPMRWDELHVPTIARSLQYRRPGRSRPRRRGRPVQRKATRSPRPGRARGWCAPTGLGHRALLRDPEVVRQAVDFLREARPR